MRRAGFVEPRPHLVERLVSHAKICDKVRLDGICCTREGGVMQINRFFAATAVASILVLAACNSEPETINGYSDPMAEQLKKAPPVKELPPSISHNRTYRCSDNSLFYVDFYTNNTALLRTRQGGDPVMLTAEGGNPPYQA